MKIDYLRQKSIIDIEKFRNNKIIIVGCGAIGTFLGICLAKMGLTQFKLYDFDKVEPHNLPNQFFGERDIGKFKVEAMTDYMYMFNSDVKTEWHGKFTKQSHLDTEIVISCVDVMETRKLIFDKCKKDKKVQLFIDTRMGGLQGQIYFVDMQDKKQVKAYGKTLFSSSEAVNLRCTERSIIFTVLGIASFVCSQIVKALLGKPISNYIAIDYDYLQIMR